jgi:hypothetical protein
MASIGLAPSYLPPDSQSPGSGKSAGATCRRAPLWVSTGGLRAGHTGLHGGKSRIGDIWLARDLYAQADSLR